MPLPSTPPASGKKRTTTRHRRRAKGKSLRYFRPQVEVLERLVLPSSTMIWVGTAGDENWNTAANWQSQSDLSMHQVPGAGDNAEIKPGFTVNLTATNDSVLNLTIDAGATLVLTGGSTLHVTGSVTGTGTITLLGGTLAHATVDTTITATAQGGTLDGVTLNGTLNDTSGGDNVTLTDGLTLGGTINVGRAATVLVSGSQSVVSSNDSVGGTGPEIVFTAHGIVYPTNDLKSNISLSDGTVWTIGANITVTGDSGSIGGSIDGSTNVGVINHGTVGSDAADGTLLLSGGSWDNEGIIEALNGATTDVEPGTLTNLVNGTLTGGTWEAGANSTLALLHGVSDNAATVILNGAGANFTTTASTTSILSGLSTNDGGGSLTIQNGAALTTVTALQNTGSITIDNGSTFTVGGVYTQTGSGSLTTVDGTLVSTANQVNIDNGTLSGNGTIDGFLFVQSPPAVVTGHVSSEKATPTVAASATPIVYGTPLADTQLSGTASVMTDGQQVNVPGSFSYGSAAGTVLRAGQGQQETVTFTPDDLDAYNSVTTTVSVDVSPATLALSVNNVDIAYGTALANGQLSGTATSQVTGANVPGSFTYTSAAGSVPGAGKGQTESVTFTPTDSTDYATATTTVTVNVAQTTPSASASATSITYGTVLSNSQLSGTASATVNAQLVAVAGSFTFGGLAGSVLTAGKHTETVTFNPTDSTDYTSATTQVTVTVGQATPSASASATGITYGTVLSNSQLSGTASAIVNGTSAAVAGSFTFGGQAGTVLTGGSHVETVTFNPTDTTDYTSTTTQVTVVVNQATPSASASATGITYGTVLSNSQLSGTASAIVNGTSAAVAGSFTFGGLAGTVLSGGSHTETVTFNPTDTTDYTSTTTQVTVVVNPATPSVSASAAGIISGVALDNSLLSGTATAIVNGSSVPVLGSFTFGSLVGTVLAGGSHVETVTFNPTDTTDYTSTTTQVTVVVARATPSVSASAASITFGTVLSNNQLSGTASAIVNGQSESVAGSFTFGGLAGTVLTGGSHVETVTFNPTDTTDYTSTTTQVTVMVNQATPSASASATSITYGTVLSNSQLSGTASAIVNGQSESVAGSFTFGGLAGTVLTGGSHVETVTFNPTDTTDYTSTTTQVTVVVNQATPSASASATGITYGTVLSNSQLSGTASAIVNGTSAAVAGSFTFGGLAGTVLTGGSHVETITFDPTDTTDYTSTSTQVTVVVARATPSASATAAGIINGVPLSNSQLSGTASAIVNGTSVAVAGSFTFGGLVGTVLTGGSHTETVTFNPTDATDYTSTTTQVTVVVSRATPTASASASAITYGTVLSNSQLSGTASAIVNGTSAAVAGSFTFGSLAGTVLTGGSHVETVTFNPTDTTDYTSTTTQVTVVVNQATPAVSASATSITYGTLLSNSLLSGTATAIVNGKTVAVAGSFTFGSLVGIKPTSGNHSEAVTFNPTDTTDYTSVPTQVTVTVNEAPTISSSMTLQMTQGTAGTFTNFTITTANGSPTPTIAENAATSTLPTGSTFTDNHNGTATLAVPANAKEGTYTFVITATNAGGTTGPETFVLNVLTAAESADLYSDKTALGDQPVTVSGPGATANVALTGANNTAALYVATYQGNPTGLNPDAAISTANNPAPNTLAVKVQDSFVYLDLRVTGGNNATATAVFNLPASAITPGQQNNFEIRYFDGTHWETVTNNDGSLPVPQAVYNGSHILTGWTVTVKLGTASTPQISELTGTVFTLALPTAAPATPVVLSPPLTFVTQGNNNSDAGNGLGSAATFASSSSLTLVLRVSQDTQLTASRTTVGGGGGGDLTVSQAFDDALVPWVRDVPWIWEMVQPNTTTPATGTPARASNELGQPAAAGAVAEPPAAPGTSDEEEESEVGAIDALFTTDGPVVMEQPLADEFMLAVPEAAVLRTASTPSAAWALPLAGAALAGSRRAEKQASRGRKYRPVLEAGC